LLAASDVAEDSLQIWQICFSAGEVRRVTNALTDYSPLSVSKDGAAMTAIQKETPAALWLATLDEPDAATRVSHGELRGFNSVVWTRDGHIVYSARSGEYGNIWITDAAGENPRQIGDARTDRDEVAVTPDGHYFLYQSKGKIWRMNADGGGATQLTHGALDMHPWRSADGREVFYSSFDPWSPVIGGTPALWRVPIDGGAASPIRSEPVSIAHVAPDGQHFAAIYFTGRDARFVPRTLAVFPINRNSAMLLIDPLPGASWHAEWATMENPSSRARPPRRSAIFGANRSTVRARAQAHGFSVGLNSRFRSFKRRQENRRGARQSIERRGPAAKFSLRFIGAYAIKVAQA
jgi:Tol biopolymer transport system component